jgi:hypothetical protein
MLKRAALFATLLGSVFVALNSLAYSQAAIPDIGSIATDPLKLGALGQSAERSVIQLKALEGQTNYDIQQRLEQIRSIIQDATNGTQAVIADATNRMQALEATINKDAINLIYRGQCASEVALMDQFQRAFTQLIANLTKADPGISILGIRLTGVTSNPVEIEDPDKAYISTKAAVLNSLDEKLTDGSNAYDILSAYQNLEVAARFARCHYIDQALDVLWVKEANDLERLSLPWVTVVKPTM